MGAWLRRSMASVSPAVGDLTQRAATSARALVTETSHARYATSPVKSDATIHAAPNAVMSHACLVLKIARGLVPMDNVECHVPFRVTVCPARNAAPSIFHAGINVLQSVGKRAQLRNTARSVETKKSNQECVNSSGVEAISAAKDTSQPLSIPVQKNCPECRATIRNVHRYGRIARRAWIDEATKKFIIWANAGFVPLAARMREVEERFQSQDALERNDLTQSLRTNFMTVPRLSLGGSPNSQMHKITSLTKKDKCFQITLRLRTSINRFLAQVNEKEQPFSRIYNLVKDAKRHRGIEGTMVWTPDVLQTRNRLLATVLALRCEYAIIANFLSACNGTGAAISLDFQDSLKACQDLIEESRSKTQPANEIEGHLFWARFTALQRSMSDTIPDGSLPLFTAREHLQTARDLCKQYQGQTAGMLSEVEDVEKALRDSTFYTSVTNEEKAAVYAAMASDFQGTGHWYNCENGHPFTVGECGMPMETSRCPQCGAAVGGQNHQAVQGVRRATDMEEQFGRLGINR
ncbi:MAG: hypothetical protein Q9168_003920 [Polycauliona sp. 1 TL-2023]